MSPGRCAKSTSTALSASVADGASGQVHCSMPRLTMPFPGSAAASLPDGPRRQRRPYNLDGPPGVAHGSSNRGRKKRVLGGSGTPSWLSKEYVDYSCPSLCGRPLAAMMNLTAASFSWRHGLVSRYKLYTCSAGRFGPSLCCAFFGGCPFPHVRTGGHHASSYSCNPSANPRLCNTSPRPLLEPSFLALHASPPSGVL